MADSKIDFSFENLHFSCEGDNAWVEKQLNNVLSRIPALLSVHKKGENIVEEVIDVKAEEVKEPAPVASRVTKKAAKHPKAKKVKAAIDKIVQEKLAKEPKTVKSERIKIARKPEEGAIAKRGRKPVAGRKSLAKVKSAKKKIAKISTDAVQTDSPLLQYLTDKKVTTNQVRKFLATAVFLSRNNGISKLSTSMISRALKSYKIDKLQNASDCLNKNEKKGYCLKEGKEFVITENGYLSIE
jgi:hypothetical protein